eukprot:Nitzschia sp. Nitz4//scaffold48_size128905//52671//53462//NITZ4_003595-RA/size128905-processed-gene-0.82-mRNA-1//1//CDS//3329552967//9172//frame0
MSVPATYQKKLEGVKVTEELLSSWKECYAQVQLNLPSGGDSQQKKDALATLKDHQSPHDDPNWVPIKVIQALHVLVQDSDMLDRALQRTVLMFTPPPASTEESAEKRKFRQRMERLRLQNEETKYVRLTNNLQKEVQDDVTAKSMTYAASVGLNMIIAPISFGGFMYIFAGGIFDYFLGEEFSSRTSGGTDIKRVIVGVVSGVLMLFVEMILFVIRTHEVEVHTTKKQKKKKAVQPFGVYAKKGEQHATPLDPLSQERFNKKN